ncbi:MAG: hypothetical protein PVH42_10010 [Desulfobacterales bacterium]|jgi:hypothetical protein
MEIIVILKNPVLALGRRTINMIMGLGRIGTGCRASNQPLCLWWCLNNLNVLFYRVSAKYIEATFHSS